MVQRCLIIVHTQ